MMHLADTRIAEAAVKLAEQMILYRQPAKFLMLQTTGLALRISGYKGSMFGYPGQRPSSTMTMMSHRSHFLDCSISEAFSRPENAIEQFVIWRTANSMPWTLKLERRFLNIKPHGP